MKINIILFIKYRLYYKYTYNINLLQHIITIAFKYHDNHFHNVI